MKINDTTIRLAMTSALEARDMLYLALVAYRFDQKQRTSCINDAIEALSNAAGDLGYDLVFRLSPQEAHEAAISRRRAEDADSKDEFDWTR